jgi:excisionase family DNA binding protein
MTLLVRLSGRIVMTASNAEKRALSILDTAELIGISRSTLYELIKEGRGPRVVKIGCRSLILADDRESWLQSLAERAAA